MRARAGGGPYEEGRRAVTGHVPGRTPASTTRAAQDAAAAGAPVEPSDQQLAVLFAAQYAQLVRLAASLLDDRGHSEEVVQESFVRVLGRLGTLRDPESAAAYLRQTVVNLSRSRLRRRIVARRLP